MTLTAPPGEYKYGRSGEIMRCPWHGWEFDILTGKSIYDPNKCLVRTYEVTVEKENMLGGLESTELLPDTEPVKVDTYPVSVEQGLVILHI
jgi:3-phenylpropionate/trans-cinnamate dioxygenase ferredoxin subunit